VALDGDCRADPLDRDAPTPQLVGARGETPTGGRRPLIRARFRLTLPDDIWVAEVSTSFPDATFRLLTGVPRGDRSLELGEVRAEAPGPAAAAIESHPDVRSFEPLHADDRRVLTKYEAAERRLYEFLWDSSLPPEFPLDVEDGEMEFDLTATREQFETFGARLDASGLSYDLLAVVHVDEGDGLLTERQRECVTVALRLGYFEVPRQCTLSELADALGVDKSSASETVRRGTARVLEQFLVGED
jgi:hypothetical protein